MGMQLYVWLHFIFVTPLNLFCFKALKLHCRFYKLELFTKITVHLEEVSLSSCMYHLALQTVCWNLAYLLSYNIPTAYLPAAASTTSYSYFDSVLNIDIFCIRAGKQPASRQPAACRVWKTCQSSSFKAAFGWTRWTTPALQSHPLKGSIAHGKFAWVKLSDSRQIADCQ